MSLLLDSLARASIEGGIAVLAVWVLTRLGHRAPARVHCWLWRLALAKALFSLAGAARIEVPLLPASQPAEKQITLDAAVAEPVRQADASEPALPVKVPDLASQLDGPWPWSAADVLWAAWMSGVGIGCVWLIHGLAQARRLRKDSIPTESEPVRRILGELRSALGIERSPEVRVTASSEMPMLIGVRHPMLLLPRWALEGPEDRLRLILAHELAHLKRRDLVWAWLPAVAQVVFFFHPLVWLARREHRLAQETACDELAMRATSARPADYAEGLLAVVARASGGSRQTVFSAGIVESKNALKRRIHSMRHIQTSARRKLAWSAAMLAFGAIAVVPFRLVAADPAVGEKRPSDDPPAQTIVYENAPPAAGAETVVRAVAVSSRRPGVVRKVHVRVGDEVKAGQLLVELETDEAELRLRAAEIRHRVARANLEAKLAQLEQEQELSNPQAIRQAESQRTRQQVETEKANLEQLLLRYKPNAAPVEEAREKIARLEAEQQSLSKPGKALNGLSPASKAAFQARRAEAEAEAQLSEIAIDEARLELKLHSIVAPCDGKVFRIGAYTGEAVTGQGRGEPVIVIETRMQARASQTSRK